MKLTRRPWLAGAAAMLLAATLVPAFAAPAGAASDYAANCGVKLRTAPSTSASSPETIPSGALVTVTSTTSGGSWSADCPSTKSGTSWYAISAVNGQNVASLYGVGTVYAATGLFRSPAYLEGVDVSTYQGTVNWPSVYWAGRRFAVMRATLGQTYADATYPKNHANARAAGVAVTAYHYAKPTSDPDDAVLEADWFVQTAALLPGDLVPALDVEEHGDLNVSGMQAWIGTWLGEVYARLGVRPMIYTSPSFWKTYVGNTSMFADQGYSVLWIAHWGVSSPSVPANNWGGHGWTFWQYSSSGSVAGISGAVDLDRYNGLDLTPMRFDYPPVPTAPPPPAQPPVVSVLAPATTTAGRGDVQITIQGANFQPSTSVAYWNQTALSTTYVSSSQLTAVVPGSMLAVPATGSVTVVTQAGQSAPVAFTVTQPAATISLQTSATVVSWGQGVTLTAGVSPSGANRAVTLQQLPVGAAAWADVTSATTDATGHATFAFRPRTNTQFRVVYAGADDLTAATSAPLRVVVRQLVLLRPTSSGAVKTVSLGTRVTFTTTVRPIGPDIVPAKVTFEFRRYVSGSWRVVATRSLTADATGRASTTWTFSSRGQWYVRSLANPTSSNANSYWTAVERYSVR